MVVTNWMTLLILYVSSILVLQINPSLEFNSAVKDSYVRYCIESERQALLEIKEELEDSYGHLSSWGSEDEKKNCCRWRGIQCSHRTGHVTVLDLQVNDGILLYMDAGRPLRGNISPSLLKLRHLSYVDLSLNNFNPSELPSFSGLSKLRYLNLSNAGFTGTLSHRQFANLTSLQSLDLSKYFGTSDYNVENLEWLADLSSLRELAMSNTDLGNAKNWRQVINKLPYLTDLWFDKCNLSGTTNAPFLINSSAAPLAVVDLSLNPDIKPNIFEWLLNFRTTLVHLELSYNFFGGLIPDTFGDMTNLADLNLRNNQFEGGIPKSFRNLCSLRSLDLSNNNLSTTFSGLVHVMSDCMEKPLETLELESNQFHGLFPGLAVFPSLKVLHARNNRLEGVSPSLGSLSKLEALDLSGNFLEGLISEAHFSNLSKLKALRLAGNSNLTLKFNSSWVPPFQLDVISLRSCNLGPDFPKWIQFQNHYSLLDISSAGVSDIVPNSFWHLPSKLLTLNLSHNSLQGGITSVFSEFISSPGIDLSSNYFEGPLPLFPLNVTSLQLSRNRFSGSVSSICTIKGQFLSFLDMSNNLLNGELPDCFSQWPQLIVLSLANNYLSGEIPPSLRLLSQLHSLNLRNNNFHGQLPSSLQNCSTLGFMDLSGNRLSGTIPTWIGQRLSFLIFLSLQSNQFSGSIPYELCHLKKIQILDLSTNNISGSLPKCLNNLTAMSQLKSYSILYTSYTFGTSDSSTAYLTSFYDTALIEWKGRQYEYKKNLGLFKLIDLSSNKLTGKIPGQILNLLGLVALNLSRNNLSGPIPQNIGVLKRLESLDLSRNQLSGGIPVSISELSFLSFLDLSSNNLSGRIPSSTQLRGFSASAFSKNVGLCGPPISQKCPGDDSEQTQPSDGGSNQDTEEDGDEFRKWLFTAMGLGFAAGFWGVYGSLLVIRSWRHAFFRFVDYFIDGIYTALAVGIARFRRYC